MLAFRVGRVTQELDMTVTCLALNSRTQCDVFIWFLIILFHCSLFLASKRRSNVAAAEVEVGVDYVLPMIVPRIAIMIINTLLARTIILRSDRSQSQRDSESWKALSGDTMRCKIAQCSPAKKKFAQLAHDLTQLSNFAKARSISCHAPRW